ncbi:MAG TPA: hypothetical protein VGG92_08215 [Caulobacteraceae bacterium]
MPRVQFEGLAGGPRATVELVVDRPHLTRPDYTPVMWLTEWLTLNCNDDWAMRVDSKVVILRFASVTYRDRVAQQVIAWKETDPP